MILVGPSGFYESEKLSLCLKKAKSAGVDLILLREYHPGMPKFLMGTVAERIDELKMAESSHEIAMLSIRGGVGAIELWQDYEPEIYMGSKKILIGYSDITILHFKRFFYGKALGIHGPTLSNLFDNPSFILENIKALLEKNFDQIFYPPLYPLSSEKNLNGELIVMNMASLQTIIGLFDFNILRGKILALEDINEPHYKVHRMLYQLYNCGILEKLSGLILGYFNLDREKIIKESILPLAKKVSLPVFDWPIFGHDIPNWPLIFGAKVSIKKDVDGNFLLRYDL